MSRLVLAFIVVATGVSAVLHDKPAMTMNALPVTRIKEPTPPSLKPVRASRSHSRRHLVPVIRSPRHNWTAVANCESSGDWHINTGNGYYGGLQEDLTFWQNYGGTWFAARPDLATEAEQIVVAERGLAVQGVGAWPVCGRFL